MESWSDTDSDIPVYLSASAPKSVPMMPIGTTALMDPGLPQRTAACRRNQRIVNGGWILAWLLAKKPARHRKQADSKPLESPGKQRNRERR
jgi:hypothetical protein